MGADDALGIARGAARAAHGGGRALVDVRPREARLLRGDELLVAKRIRQRIYVAIADDDEGLHRRELRRDRREEKDQRSVDEDDAVLCVIDDVGDLLGEEPQVERVQDRAHSRNGEVRLLVRLVVPREGRHTVARTYAQSSQRGSDTLGPLTDLGERRGVGAITGPGENLALPVEAMPCRTIAGTESWKSSFIVLLTITPPFPPGRRTLFMRRSATGARRSARPCRRPRGSGVGA